MRTLLVGAVAMSMLVFGGCKKDGGGGGAAVENGTTGATGAGTTGTGTGTGGTEPAQAGKKAPEGCNSDLSQKIEVDYAFTEKCSPYTVPSELYVDGFTLTIEPGVELRFKDGAAMYVGYGARGRLLVKGTKEKPVKFTAERKEAGSWKTLQIFEKGEQSSLENLVLEYGGNDTAALRVSGADVTVKNVKFVSVKSVAVDVDGEGPLKEFSGVDLSGAGDEDELVKINAVSLNALGAGNVFPPKAVIAIRGNVNKDQKMSAQGAPYRINGEFYVEAPEGKSAVLTIEAGTTVQWGENGGFYVGYGAPGALKVQGTKEKPVTFTRYGEDQKTTPWKGLIFYSNARAPEIDNAVFEYVGRQNEEALKFSDNRGLGKITNSVFRHVAGTAIKVETSKARFDAFDGNSFEDVGAAALELPIELAHKLGTANKFGSTYVVLRDTVQTDVTLGAIDGAYWGQGELYVNSPTQGKTASLTLEPNTKVKMMENAALYVGYSGAGKLSAKNASFEAVQGKWKGLKAYAAGVVELDTVSISGVQPDSYPLELDADSSGTVKDVTFKDTGKGLHNCGKAKASGLKADKGVKADEKC